MITAAMIIKKIVSFSIYCNIVCVERIRLDLRFRNKIRSLDYNFSLWARIDNNRFNRDVECDRPTRVRRKTGPAVRPSCVVRARLVRTGQRQEAARAGRGEKTGAFAVPEVDIRRSVRRRGAHVSGDAESGTVQGPGMPGGTTATVSRARRHRPTARVVRHERAVPEFGPQPDRHRNRQGVRTLRLRHVQVGTGPHARRRRDQNVRYARSKIEILAVTRVGRDVLVAQRHRHGDGPSRPKLGTRRLRAKFCRRRFLAFRRQKQRVHCRKRQDRR